MAKIFWNLNRKLEEDLIPRPVLYFRLPYAMDTDLSSQDRKDLDKFIKFFALKVIFLLWTNASSSLVKKPQKTNNVLGVARVTRLRFGFVGFLFCFAKEWSKKSWCQI